MFRCRKAPFPVVLALLVAPVGFAPPVFADGRDVGMLLDGVKSPGVGKGTTALASFGPGSFPVVAASIEGTRAPIVAAARWRAGRTVVFAERGLADGDAGRRLLRNAVTWCAGTNRAPTVTIVGGVVRPDALSSAAPVVLAWSVQELRLRMEAPDFDVAVVDADIVRGPDGRRVGEFLTAFVKGGGGVVYVGDSGAPPVDPTVRSPLGPFEPNRMIAPMGIAWTRRPVDPEPESPTEVALDAADARLALKRLWDRESGKPVPDEETAAATTRVIHALMAAPIEEGWFTSKAVQFATKHAGETPLPWGVGHAAEKIRAVLNWRGVRWAGSKSTTPLRAGYPFAVANTPTGGVQIVRVPAGFTGLIPTDLAARPGVSVVVTAPGAAAGSGFLRFGVHAPFPFSSARWDRFPELRARYPLSKDFEATVPFGGPISLEIVQAPTSPLDIKFQEVDHVASAGAEGSAAPGWSRVDASGAIWWVPPGLDRFSTASNLAALGEAVRVARSDLGRPVSDTARWTFDPASASGAGVVGVPAPATDDPAEMIDPVATVAAVALSRDPDGWFGQVVGVALAPRIPGPEAPARQLARARAGAPTLAAGSARRELLLQLRDAFGAAPMRQAATEHSRLGESDSAEFWVRALSRATGRDLRPHFQAFRALNGPFEDARLAELPAWNGLAVDRTAPPTAAPPP